MSVKDNILKLRSLVPPQVTLVAVSKFHPVERLMEAYDAGQRVFGENRPQEFAAKVPMMPADVQWHFIGHLQTNKLKLVLPYVSLLESVDSLHLLEAVNAWGKANGKVVPVLLELHLGAEESKHGFSPEEILSIIKGNHQNIKICGLMGMATNTDDADVVENDFSRIHELFLRIRSEHPALSDTFTELSIGMSGDWPLAVKHGATIIRIGTDIFGPREY